MYKNLTNTFYLVLIWGMVAACSLENAKNQSGCENGSVLRNGVCVSKTNLVADCKNPDLSKILAGEKGTLCDGSEAVGTYVVPKDCTSDGEQNCVSKNNFKAAETSKITASNLLTGESTAGVSGTARRTKLCRNYANLSSFDLTYLPSNLGMGAFVFAPANVNTATDQITLPYAHGLSTNMPLRFTTSGTLPAPLVVGTTYYAINISSTVIRVASVVNGSAIDITSQGTVSHTAVDTGDGILQYFETVDDSNFGLTVSPPNNPWSSDQYLCDSSNFVNVTSSSSPFLPSGAIPSTGNQAFTQIWQDQLTGLYFSNVVYDGTSGSRTWSDAIRTCESLNGGTAGSGWRLPTQKELMQMYVNGFSRLTVAGGASGYPLWSSTNISIFTSRAWTIDKANGRTNYGDKNAVNAVLCVR